MDRGDVEQWVSDYERLWRAPGTGRLADLFAPEASYLPSPWAEPVQGLEAIAGFWESERQAGEEFTMSSAVVAVDGPTAVVRVSVEYTAPRRTSWRDLWVLRFGDDGRCSRFEEWPFAPEQSDGHQPGSGLGAGVRPR